MVPLEIPLCTPRVPLEFPQEWEQHHVLQAPMFHWTNARVRWDGSAPMVMDGVMNGSLFQIVFPREGFPQRTTVRNQGGCPKRFGFPKRLRSSAPTCWTSWPRSPCRWRGRPIIAARRLGRAQRTTTPPRVWGGVEKELNRCFLPFFARKKAGLMETI